MLSSQFLSSHCIFAAAVNAFRNASEEARAAPEQRAVVNAFKNAMQGLSKDEEVGVVEYLQRLLQIPGNLESDKRKLNSAEHQIDFKLAKKGGVLIDGGNIILGDELISRTGWSQEVLEQKIHERKIFKMPHWVEYVWGDDYFPAFFADSRYDLDSLETVSKALRAYDGLRKYRFFTTPDPMLSDRTPLEALVDKDLDQVLISVRAFRKRSPQLRLKAKLK